jgi:NADPH-dependent ferric siderophore reductase
MQIDMHIDFQWIDEDGLTLAMARNTRSDVDLTPGEYVIVGDDDCEPSIARIVEHTSANGLIRLRVLPGDASDYPELLNKMAVGAS